MGGIRTPIQVRVPMSANAALSLQPVVNPHELFLSQINSTVVNQSLKNSPGELGFKVTFDQHEKVTKNMTWTYSNEVGRLYVMLNSQCPFKISTNSPPPEHSYIVCIPAYKDAVSISLFSSSSSMIHLNPSHGQQALATLVTRNFRSFHRCLAEKTSSVVPIIVATRT